jgi:hypothetical protein
METNAVDGNKLFPETKAFFQEAIAFNGSPRICSFVSMQKHVLIIEQLQRHKGTGPKIDK